MARLIEQIKAVQQLINCGGVENAFVSFDCQSDRLRLRVELKECTLTSGNLEGVTVSKGLFYLEDLNLELPPAEMIKAATVRVESLVVRVAAGLINRVLTSEKAKRALTKLPVEIRDLGLAMSGQQMTISGQVRKVLNMGFSVDLKPYVKGNNVCIAFESFYLSNLLPMPGYLRRALMSVVNQKLVGDPRLKGVMSIDGDVITINPWKKIPVKVNADIIRFGVEGHSLLIAFGSAPWREGKGKPAASGADTEATAKAAKKTAADKSESGRPVSVVAAVAGQKLVMPAANHDGDMVLPFV